RQETRRSGQELNLRMRFAKRHIPAHSGTPLEAVVAAFGRKPDFVPALEIGLIIQKHPQPVVYPRRSAGILHFEFCILNSLSPVTRVYAGLSEFTRVKAGFPPA